MKLRRFWIWNEYKECCGVICYDDKTPPTSVRPYWIEIYPPSCPEKPNVKEWPDGWYLVRNIHGSVVARCKKGNECFYHDDRNTCAKWDTYKVLASLEGVKFIDDE